MALRFGTDGVRGKAHEELTADVAYSLGRAAVEVLGRRFVIGADTRESGPALTDALIAGIAAAGGSAENLGVVPTPTVAWAAANRPAAAAMISASHNPYYDNGIKLFASGGLKLPDDVEADIEKRYLEYLHAKNPSTGESAGEPKSEQSEITTAGVQGWVDLVVESVAPNALAGLAVVIDCAHGAAHKLGPEPFRRLGAEVIVIGDTPNGTNINDGVGSTHPEKLMEEVVATGADAGLAFDGDADRLIAVDESGMVVDGDRVLALLANDWAAGGRLKKNTVVVTVMSNLGFHRAMASADINVATTGVGDRYVLAELDEHGYSLGGEQSGHVICRDLSTTGDGVLTGVQLLDVVARSNGSFSDMAENVMTTVPQILENVQLPRRMDDPGAVLADDIAAASAAFGDEGRVLVRASGTEPVLRIMVEHLDPNVARSTCDDLVAKAKQKLA